MNLHLISDQVAQVSANYARKFKIVRDHDWFLFKLHEELGELTQAYLMLTGRGRQKGKTKAEIQEEFERECTDVFCHVLLLARENGIDMEKQLNEKWFKYLQKKEEEIQKTPEAE